jgi:uncharacterized peroxidase-related enzyme
MSRLNTIAPETATGKVKQLLDGVQHKLGMVPNMMRIMANSPAVLDGYLHLNGSLSLGKLPAKIREQLALAISEANQCEYCLGAHSTVGKMVGLTGDQIRDARLGTAVDAKTDVLLHFARKVLDSHGRVSQSDLEEVHEAGYDDGEIAEVIAHVALNVLTNFFNNAVETDLDFPKAAKLTATAVA